MIVVSYPIFNQCNYDFVILILFIILFAVYLRSMMRTIACNRAFAEPQQPRLAQEKRDVPWVL